MKLRRWLVVVLCAVAGVAAAAAAVKPGSTLYVRARNTRVLKAPGSSEVKTILQPGDKVKWLGKDKNGWHTIKAGGYQGVVLGASLSVKPLQMELVSSDGKRDTDATAFLNSGAATKALGPGAIAYGDRKKKDGEEHSRAVRDASAMEKIAKTVTTADIAAHAGKVGIVTAVGPVAKVGEK
jgi:uncharacterized protein YgiM (DUF1202 family)